MKTLVISGAGGFLGRNLLSLADSKCLDVYALSSKIGDTSGVHYVSREKIAEIPWSQVDVLINCAFPRNTDGMQMAEGLDYIQRLFNISTDGGVGAVINISSQSVYSQRRTHAADESEPLNLESTYAVGKYATELLLNTCCDEIKHTNLRMASLIGPCFDQRIVNRFIKKALANETLNVLSGKQLFGFMDVRDATAAIINIAEHDCSPWDEVYNLGTEEAYSILDIAYTVKRVVEKERGGTVSICEKADDTVFCSALNSQKFCSSFDWHPLYSLEQTVEEICKMEIRLNTEIS